MKLLDWILIVIILALAVIALRFVTDRRKSGCHGCCNACCARSGKCKAAARKTDSLQNR